MILKHQRNPEKLKTYSRRIEQYQKRLNEHNMVAYEDKPKLLS